MNEVVIQASIPDAQIEKVIQKFVKVKESENEDILTINEASEFLGISVRQMHVRTNRGEIPFFTKKGIRHKLFLLSQLIPYK